MQETFYVLMYWTGFVAWVFILAIIILFWKFCMDRRIYCCECGKKVDLRKDCLFGGAGSHACPRCETTLNYKPIWSDKYENISLGFWDFSRYYKSLVYLCKNTKAKKEKIA